MIFVKRRTTVRVKKNKPTSSAVFLWFWNDDIFSEILCLTRSDRRRRAVLEEKNMSGQHPGDESSCLATVDTRKCKQNKFIADFFGKNLYYKSL